MTPNPTRQPDGPRIRLEGTVTAVHADGRFVLQLADGHEITATATGPQLRRLGKHLPQVVLVLGMKTPGDSIAVDGVLPAQGPFILGVGDTPLSPAEADESAARFRSVLGKWPRDESDEQIAAAMKDDR